MIVTIGSDRRFHNRVARLFPDREDIAHAEGVAEVESSLAAADSNLDVLVFGPEVPVDDVLETARWLRTRGTPTAVLGIVDAVTQDLLRSALRAGVTDLLATDASDDELREALTDAEGVTRAQRGSHVNPADPTGGGKIITVFSTKGGSGKSVIATNLALLLRQRTGASVALVDLDLQSGDLAIMLQLLPAWTIYDATENIERLDVEALRGYLTPHRGGVSLLAAPLEPALADTVSGPAVHTILESLRLMFDYVVVDGPAFFTDQVLAALDVTDECILVASMDVPSVKNLKLSLKTFQQLGFVRERLHLVLNRADSKVGLRIQEVEKSLDTRIDVSIPSSREVPLSVNQGTPLADGKGRSSVVSAINQLVDRVRVPSNGHTPTDGGYRKLLGRS
jgi:pilus assembly protein CpaE